MKPFICYWGINYAHAIPTLTLGVYHCPFRSCFKRLKTKEEGKGGKKWNLKN